MDRVQHLLHPRIEVIPYWHSFICVSRTFMHQLRTGDFCCVQVSLCSARERWVCEWCFSLDTLHVAVLAMLDWFHEGTRKTNENTRNDTPLQRPRSKRRLCLTKHKQNNPWRTSSMWGLFRAIDVGAHGPNFRMPSHRHIISIRVFFISYRYRIPTSHVCVLLE